MDAAERTMLLESTRHVLESSPPGDVAAQLRELGWWELRTGDRRAAEGTFFELQGETLARSSVLDAVVLEALGSIADPDRTAVLHPWPGPPDRRDPAGAGRAVVDGLVGHPGALEAVVVPAGGGHLVVSGADLARLDLSPVAGMDPDLGWRRVCGPAPTAASAVGADTGGGATTRPAYGATATATVRRALAHELVGVSRAMLTLAVDHARDRHQFGRPIGSFQAVQTRLADGRVALEVAEQAAAAAWESTDELSATMAKLLAGRAARQAAKQCQQVLGGMGFTWEHPLHRYVRRALALDALEGSAAGLTVGVGAALSADGVAPGLVHI